MADKTLTVNGQPFTFNRDKFAGVRTMTVNGETVTVDRTAQVIDSDRKGESRPLLSKVVGGAAAAYSLRDLNDKQGNNKVVRVRRASDNHERDFVAKEVSNGTLTDWVNTQVVAPLDLKALTATGRDGAYQIAKAAYSLRSLGTRQATLAATGDTVARADGKFVVQVRRSSDDALKSFTADEITDGTLLAFVTDAQVGWNVQPTFSNDSGTGSVTSQSSTATTATVSFTGDADLLRETSKPNHVLASSGDQVTFNMSVSGLDSAMNLRLRTSGTNTTVGTASVGNGDNQDITISLTGGAGYIAITAESAGGATITFNSIKVLPKTGFVKTWYDQSVTNEAGDTATGNHATQGTAASQPKIVINGALNADGIKFDGVDDFLDAPLPSINSSSALSVFTAQYQASKSILGDTSNRRLIFGSTTAQFYLSLLQINQSYTSVPSGQTSLFSAIHNGTNSVPNVAIHANGNASAQTSVNQGSLMGNNPIDYIGKNQGTSGASFYNQFVQEIIIYGTDQTDNRTALEANIGETYSIDLPSGVDTGFDQVDGFVETWYDQSGNGRDATQATAGSQPKIVDGGALVTGGLKFEGAQGLTTGSPILSDIKNAASFTVFSVPDNSTNPYIFWVSYVSRWYVSVRQSVVGGNSIGATMVPSNNTATLRTTTTSDSACSFFNNGSQVGTTRNVTEGGYTHGTSIGANHNISSSFLTGNIQEFVLYQSDQSANRPAIEANINNQYEIY